MYKIPKSKLLAGRPKFLSYSIKGVRKGTCKRGERADLTGCIPASKDDTGKRAAKKPVSATVKKPKKKTEKEKPAAYVPELGDTAKGIIRNLDETAKENANDLFNRLEYSIPRLTSHWLEKNNLKTPEQIKEVCRKKLEEAEITINISFDMLVPNTPPSEHDYDEETMERLEYDYYDDGHEGGDIREIRLIESLMRDASLKNLFEVGTGNGSTNTRVRSRWEQSNFGDNVIDVNIRERPKYGAVNWGAKSKGGASGYGADVIVLNHEKLKDRITIAPDNTSSTSMEEVGTFNNPENAILRSGSFANFVSNLDSYDYTEVQVWGELPINSETIKEIRVKKRNNNYHKKMIAFAKKYGIPVRVME